MNRSACIMLERSGACQHSTDGSAAARMKWLLEENSKGTRWEWVAERSSLLGCENGHLHRGGPAPHFSPACTAPRLTGRQCTVKQKNTGRRRGQSAEQCSLTKSTSVPPCGANWTPSPPLPLKKPPNLLSRLIRPCSFSSVEHPKGSALCGLKCKGGVPD